MEKEVIAIIVGNALLFLGLAGAVLRARAEQDDLASREYPESDCFPPRKAPREEL